jgi:hypothetical protein
VELDAALDIMPKSKKKGGCKEDRWIIGAYCPSSREGSLVIVPDKTEKTILDFIQKHIKAGSIIHTNKSTSFKSIRKLPVCIFFTVDINLLEGAFFFLQVDPPYEYHSIKEGNSNEKDQRVSTNHVKNFWSHCKRRFIRMGNMNMGDTSSYIDDYLWRNIFAKEGPEETLKNLLTQIGEWYQFDEVEPDEPEEPLKNDYANKGPGNVVPNATTSYSNTHHYQSFASTQAINRGLPPNVMLPASVLNNGMGQNIKVEQSFPSVPNSAGGAKIVFLAPVPLANSSSEQKFLIVNPTTNTPTIVPAQNVRFLTPVTPQVSEPLAANSSATAQSPSTSEQVERSEDPSCDETPAKRPRLESPSPTPVTVPQTKDDAPKSNLCLEDLQTLSRATTLKPHAATSSGLVKFKVQSEYEGSKPEDPTFDKTKPDDSDSKVSKPHDAASELKNLGESKSEVSVPEEPAAEPEEAKVGEEVLSDEPTLDVQIPEQLKPAYGNSFEKSSLEDIAKDSESVSPAKSSDSSVNEIHSYCKPFETLGKTN